MSLATTSGLSAGGGGAGGLVMAHQAHATGQGALPPPRPAGANATTTGHGVPLLLGADLADKNQSLSVRQVKNVAHLPIVGIDLHAPEPLVAYFPPKPEDPSGGATPILVGKMKSTLYWKATEAAHKTLRKFLDQTKSFASLQQDVLSSSTDSTAVAIDKPYRWLGLRRTMDAPDFYRGADEVEAATSSSNSSHAIDQDDAQGVGAFLVNSTLDGKVPTGDDFDRVVWKVRLTPTKKAFPVLPEEAVQILLHQAQHHVALKFGDDKDNTEILDYPCAIALPAWSFHDSAVEALLDGCPAGAVLFPRSICALVASVLPPLQGSKPSQLLVRIATVRKASRMEYEKHVAVNKNHDAVWEEDITLIMVGMTAEGLEATAIQLASENNTNVCALFSVYKVISNVAYRDKNPSSLLQRCTTELEQEVGKIAPEADGPSGIVFYGSQAETEQLKGAWEKMKGGIPDWAEVPVFTTKSDAVAIGASILGGVSHGRSTRVVTSDSKARPEMAIHVSNVSPVAVGIRTCYDGDSSEWSSLPVKTIFDFDRRIPAGPFSIDLKAAECVVYCERDVTQMTEEEFLKAVAEHEGSKGIPRREEAALNLRVQIVEKWTRDSEWKQVGETMKPLVFQKETDDGNPAKEDACESVTLELSLGVTGLITTSLIGDRESVVQATISARKSFFRFWIGIGAAVLFFGGFLVKSYYEEYVFHRDVKRLLAYYKHVIPGSISDGDEQNARHLVWKYRYKKERLWNKLETKYGRPVLHAHEWDKVEPAELDDDANVDLDESEDKEKDTEDAPSSKETDEL